MEPITIACVVQTTCTRLLANADGSTYPVEDVTLALDATDATNQIPADPSAQAILEIQGLKPTDWTAGRKVRVVLTPLA